MALLRLLLFCIALPALAANSITPGTVGLWATFEEIGVRANFTGDDNQNAVFSVRYKASASSTYKNAFYATNNIDRRSVNMGGSNGTNQNQGRLSIVGLTANTSYDVETTFTDADGGSASAVNSVTTLSYSPPAPGSQLYVDASAGSEGSGSIGSPYKTITNALAKCAAGDTINVSAGSYVPFIWTHSGDATHYIVLKGASTNTTIITGGAIDYNIRVNANYIVIDGFQMANSQLVGVQVLTGQHHVYIQNTFMPDVGIATTFGSGAVTTAGSCHDIYALTNNWITARDGSTSQALDGWYRLGDPQSMLVCSDNTITGSFWDGFGGSGAGAGHADITMSRCTVNGFLDDGVETDGDAINFRVGPGNIFTSKGHDSISAAPVYVGPCYIYRNVLLGTNSTGFYKLGIAGGTDGPLFIFHNTADSPVNTDGVTAAGGGNYTNTWFFNNILKTTFKCIAPGIGTNTDNRYDYNCYGRVDGNFHVTWNFGETEDFTTLAGYQAGKGQDAHSVDAGAGTIWTGSAYRLATNSAARNIGLVITNFNDASSAWPYESTGPDAGAYEIIPDILFVQGPQKIRGIRLNK